MKKTTIAALILVGGLFASCGDKKAQEVAKIPIEMKTERFDQQFFTTPISELASLKEKFPYLFPTSTPDSVWIAKQQDTLQQELFEEISKAFPDFSTEEAAIKSVFQYVKYYFPTFRPSKLVTVTTEVDYLDSRVIYADSLLFIGLDNYLGEQHHFYNGIENYIRSEFDKKYISVDVAHAIAEKIVPKTRNATLLEAMIYEGKLLYLTQKFTPETPEADVLKYKPEKYDWAVANEAEIWRYFVENQLLYSTDKKTQSRFIEVAPFSKFYLELDSQSPGGIGRFIGLQIVKQYAENHPELPSIGATPWEQLFKEANYKPKK